MKIRSLYIKNFRSLSLVDVSNLPDFVMIVGENGIGKSSIFDAIRFAKTMVAPYTYSDTSYWKQQNRMENLIRVGQDEMVVRIGFELDTDYEQEIMGDHEPLLQVTYQRNNQMVPSYPAPLQGLLTKWQVGASVGAIEYIPANRMFQEGQVNLQNMQQSNTEDFLYRRLSEIQNKYHDTKQKFVNSAVHDFLRPNDPPNLSRNESTCRNSS